MWRNLNLSVSDENLQKNKQQNAEMKIQKMKYSIITQLLLRKIMDLMFDN